MKKNIYIWILFLIINFNFSVYANHTKKYFVKTSFLKISKFLQNYDKLPVFMPNFQSLCANKLDITSVLSKCNKSDASLIELLKSIEDASFFKPASCNKTNSGFLKVIPDNIKVVLINLKDLEKLTKKNFCYYYVNFLRYSPIYFKQGKYFMIFTSYKIGIYLTDNNSVVAFENLVKPEGAGFDYFFISVMNEDSSKVEVYALTIGEKCKLLNLESSNSIERSFVTKRLNYRCLHESKRDFNLKQELRYKFFAKVVEKLQKNQRILKNEFLGKEVKYILDELRFKNYKTKYCLDPEGIYPFYMFYDSNQNILLNIYVENQDSSICTGIELFDLNKKIYEFSGIVNLNFEFRGNKIYFLKTLPANLFKEISKPYFFKICKKLNKEASYNMYMLAQEN